MVVIAPGHQPASPCGMRPALPGELMLWDGSICCFGHEERDGPVDVHPHIARAC
jgi:hypothetical protein